MTRYIGVIGYPLKHTLSPVFQQAAVDYYNLDVQYQVWETEDSNLSATIEKLKQSEYMGANVTVPYKQTVLNMLHTVDDTTGLLKAVNTIVNKEGILTGYNTDVYGFMQALQNEAKFEPNNKSAIILGSGGSARAICFSLLFNGISAITIFNRTESRSEALKHELNNYISSQKKHTEVVCKSWQQIADKNILKNADLLVNCTTIGMKHSKDEFLSPITADVIPSGILVYDLVYNPEQTPLLKAAYQAGAKILNGLPMLIYQGAASFELFIGKKAPVDVMFEAAKRALHNINSAVN